MNEYSDETIKSVKESLELIIDIIIDFDGYGDSIEGLKSLLVEIREIAKSAYLKL